MKNILFAGVVFCSAALCAADIHLAGDSTCTSYPASRLPQAGWGQMLNEFCKPGVKVFNRALGGYSTKLFIDNGYWDKLIAAVKPGDYVLIQFGHNDEKKENPKLYADPETDYQTNLKKMIADIRAKNANPVLVTSIVRCKYNRRGKMRDSGLYVFRNAVLKVAGEENVPVVNMNAVTEEKFNKIGEAEALKYFMYSSENPKQKGRDRTHTNVDGAKLIASWLVEDCKKQNLPVAECFK